MRTRTFSLLLVLILFAFLLRTFRLDQAPLRGDEAFTVLFVQQPFGQLWDEIRTIESNPPLLYLLLRAWIDVAGSGEFSTRFFSVFFGVLCVPLIYRVACEMLAAFDLDSRGVRVGLFATLLVTINPFQIWHSQDVRNYTLWPALTLTSLIFFFRWITTWKRGAEDKARTDTGSGLRERRPFPSDLLLYTLFTLLSLFAHYYAAFIVIAQNIFVLIVLWRRWRAWGEWAVSHSFLGVFFLAWALIYSNRVTGIYGAGLQQGAGLLDIVRSNFSSLVLGVTLPAWAHELGWIPFALITLVSFLWLARKHARAALWFALYIGITTLAIFILNLTRPLYFPRYFNGIAPGYYLLIALGMDLLLGSARSSAWSRFPAANPGVDLRALASLIRWRPLAFTTAWLLVVVLAAFALLNYYFNEAYVKAPDWRALTSYIHESSRAGDVVLQNFPEMSLIYYLGTSAPVHVLPEEFLPNARTERKLAALARDYSRVWFIPAAPDAWDPDHFAEEWLDSHSDLQQEDRVGTFHVALYTTEREFLPARTPTQIRLDVFAELIGYRLEHKTGQTKLVLYWQSVAATKMNYTVFTHALAPDGVLITGTDNEPVHGTRPTSGWAVGEIVVDQYQLNADEPGMLLEVGMYDRETNVRVPLFEADGSRISQDRYLIRPDR